MDRGNVNALLMNLGSIPAECSGQRRSPLREEGGVGGWVGEEMSLPILMSTVNTEIKCRGHLVSRSSNQYSSGGDLSSIPGRQGWRLSTTRADRRETLATRAGVVSRCQTKQAATTC